MDIRIKRITAADKNLFLCFLEEIDNLFVPHLSSKQPLNCFCDKILDLGNVLVVEVEQTIVGAICYYTNNKQNLLAYVSLVGVKTDYSGQRIATCLVREMILDASKQGMKVVGIHTNNTIALNLYLKCGFEIISSDNSIPTRFYLERKL